MGTATNRDSSFVAVLVCLKRSGSMREAERYYDNTESLEPNYVIGEFLKLGVVPGKALELGCGAGRDTVCLIKNGWYVLAIDKEDVGGRIRGRLDEDESKRFRFSRQWFEDAKLEECDLIVANFSLLFCDKSRFVDLWRKVEESICCGGYFVGNFFGDRDEWAESKRKMKHWHVVNVIARKRGV